MSEYDDDDAYDDDDDRDDEYYEDLIDRERDDDAAYDYDVPDFVSGDADLMELYESGDYDWLADAEVDEVELGADYPHG